MDKKEYIRKWRSENKERIAKYNKKYSKYWREKFPEKHRANQKRCRENKLEQYNKVAREYKRRKIRTDIKFRERLKNLSKKYHKKHGHKRYERQKNVFYTPAGFARYKVSLAIKCGKLIRPENCSQCFKSFAQVGKIQAHHSDYSIPLKVEWLCQLCHSEKHWK